MRKQEPDTVNVKIDLYSAVVHICKDTKYSGLAVLQVCSSTLLHCLPWWPPSYLLSCIPSGSHLRPKPPSHFKHKSSCAVKLCTLMPNTSITRRNTEYLKQSMCCRQEEEEKEKNGQKKEEKIWFFYKIITQSYRSNSDGDSNKESFSRPVIWLSWWFRAHREPQTGRRIRTNRRKKKVQSELWHQENKE